MNFFLVGVSHKTAPIEVRERLAFPEDRLPDALRAVASMPGVREVLILSTCNRVEILARGDSPDTDLPPTLTQFLADFHATTLQRLEPHLYHHRHREAIRHVFRVAASLDSMIIGETQILGQVKEAYSLARAA